MRRAGGGPGSTGTLATQDHGAGDEPKRTRRRCLEIACWQRAGGGQIGSCRVGHALLLLPSVLLQSGLLSAGAVMTALAQARPPAAVASDVEPQIPTSVAPECTRPWARWSVACSAMVAQLGTDRLSGRSDCPRYIAKVVLGGFLCELDAALRSRVALGVRVLMLQDSRWDALANRMILEGTHSSTRDQIDMLAVTMNDAGAPLADAGLPGRRASAAHSPSAKAPGAS